MLLILLTLAVCPVSAFASFFIKKASNSYGSNSAPFLNVLKSKYLYAGGALYILGTAAAIWLIKRVEYSVFVPLGGTTYIWTMLISRKFLHEKIGKLKILGVFLIIAGVCCVAL